MEFDPKLRNSALALGLELRDRPWFASVGIAQVSDRAVFVIYLQNPISKKVLNTLPNEWDGSPVMVRNMGKLVPAGPEHS